MFNFIIFQINFFKLIVFHRFTCAFKFFFFYFIQTACTKREKKTLNTLRELYNKTYTFYTCFRIFLNIIYTLLTIFFLLAYRALEKKARKEGEVKHFKVFSTSTFKKGEINISF